MFHRKSPTGKDCTLVKGLSDFIQRAETLDPKGNFGVEYPMAEHTLSEAGLEETWQSQSVMIGKTALRQRTSLDLPDVHWNISPPFRQTAVSGSHRAFLSHLSFYSSNL